MAHGTTTGGLVSRQRAGGSGVVVGASGLIVTNAHVVASATRVQVVLPPPAPAAGERRSIVRPRGEVIEAKVIGLDAETDLAVLRVPRSNLPALEFADSDGLRQGQLVFAFGNPLGLEDSVSMVIVSAVGRQRQADDPMVYVQTDAPINPGSSGVPLVDTAGRVVGISTFIVSSSGGSEGLGFAIPSNIVRAVFDQVRASGRVRRGTIGVEAQTITPGLAAGLQLDRLSGVVVADVLPGGPGELAGLMPGDVVLSQRLMSTAYYELLCQEDLDVGTGATTKRNPGGGTLAATQVGIHTFAVNQLKTTTTWDPGSISSGASEEKDVTLTGAALGDFCLASFWLDLAGLTISCYVSAANAVTVTLANLSGAAVNLASGTLAVIVFKSA